MAKRFEDVKRFVKLAASQDYDSTCPVTANVRIDQLAEALLTLIEKLEAEEKTRA